MKKLIEEAKERLGNKDALVTKAPWGARVSNPPVFGLESKMIGEQKLDLNGCVFLELYCIFQPEIILPERSHEEEAREFIRNDGRTPIIYHSAELTGSAILRDIETIEPGQTFMTVDGEQGFYHGFTMESGPSLMYVAKALHPEWVDGNYFRMPYNTFPITRHDEDMKKMILEQPEDCVKSAIGQRIIRKLGKSMNAGEELELGQLACIMRDEYDQMPESRIGEGIAFQPGTIAPRYNRTIKRFVDGFNYLIAQRDGRDIGHFDNLLLFRHEDCSKGHGNKIVITDKFENKCPDEKQFVKYCSAIGTTGVFVELSDN